jgi:hypothetical protein
MSDEWKSLISEATDNKIRELPAEKAAKENKLEGNSAQVKTMFDTIIIPALNELKVEFDKHNTPASVTGSADTVSDRVHRRVSITVDLSNLLRDVNRIDYPKFFYEICIEASPYAASYHNKCHIIDTKGQRRDLLHIRDGEAIEATFDIDLTSDSSPVLTSDNIKQDVGLKYNASVKSLRSTHVYG